MYVCVRMYVCNSMYVFMYVCLYVCVCMYVYMHACMYMYVCMYVCMYAIACICMYLGIWVCLNENTWKRIADMSTVICSNFNHRSVRKLIKKTSSCRIIFSTYAMLMSILAVEGE